MMPLALGSFDVTALLSHHVMWTAPSMTPMYSLDQDYQNEVQHDLFHHVTPLAPALASCDDDSVVNGTIGFLWSDNQHEV